LLKKNVAAKRHEEHQEWHRIMHGDDREEVVEEDIAVDNLMVS
jgi:hypothetical protein